MKQEDKDLLLRDLCARLPYGVKIHTEYGIEILKSLEYVDLTCYINSCNRIDTIRPYLRPMSSMTKEEKEKYCELQDEVLYSSGRLVTDNIADMVDWLNSCHFDWRGLIPKGLALSAPENIYNIK